jgi:hypothetical protein
MKQLDEFRIYYNKTIHPELLRMERLRIRLIRLLFFSCLMLIGIIILEIYLQLLIITLFLSIPIALLIVYLAYRMRKFKRTFKPNVMNLILDFMDEGLNRGSLMYDQNQSISRETFFQSGLFVGKAPFFKGEDYISGKVGEMDFELSEMDIRQVSPVSNKLDQVFKGVFLHAFFPEETEGEIKIWPRDRFHHYSRAVKAFTWNEGINVDYEIMNDWFRSQFVTYALPDTHVIGILSDPMQEALANYVYETGKEIFMAFSDQDIYVAVTEDKDILEPNILRSNLSFELVREFFEDVQLLLRIIEDFDQTH